MSNPTQSMPAILRFRLTKTRRVRGILVGSGVKVRPESGRASCSNDTVPHQPNPPGPEGRKPPGDPSPTPPQGGARRERGRKSRLSGKGFHRTLPVPCPRAFATPLFGYGSAPDVHDPLHRSTIPG